MSDRTVTGRAPRGLPAPAARCRSAPSCAGRPRRRRTQLALGFMVLLPLIILVAFEFGGGDDDDNGGGAVRQPGRARHRRRAQLRAVHALRLGRRSCWSWWSRCSAATRSRARRAGAACATCWRSRCPRARLLGVKLIVALVYSALALLAARSAPRCSPAPLRYGWNPLRSTIAAEIPPGEGLLRLLRHRSATWRVTLLVVAGLAFLLSVSTDAPLGAVGGAVLLWILSSILDQITALGALRNFLPTHYSARLARPAVHADPDRRHRQGDASRRWSTPRSSGAWPSGASPQGHRLVGGDRR